MVDTVRNSPSTGSATVQDQKKSRVSQAETSQTSAADKATAVSSQSVSVDLSVSEKVKSLSSEPPVNIEVVNEIRQKVSEGRYPIDLNAITTSYLKALRKAKDRVAMDIEGLIENLKALSDILKSRPIRESVSLNDFKNSYDRFEAAVSDLRVVSKQSVQRDPTKLRSILENLQKTISELDELCDDRLNLLDFVSQITPVKEIKD